MPKHHNSFDFLRLIFASMVIITHSLVLTGMGDADFIYRWTGGQTNCSYLGVRGFFLISGFLIFKSLLRSKSIFDYLKKRALRIFPALIVMLLAVTFIAGPFLTHLSLAEYFGSSEPWRYIASALRIPGIRKTALLPGVFAHNPNGAAVNGSLWTIWFELIFYAGLLILFFLFRNKARLLNLLLPASWLLLFIFFLTGHHFLDIHVFPLTGMSAEVAADLGLFFLAGSALTLIRWERTELRLILTLAGLLIIGLGLSFHLFGYLRYVGIPLFLLGIGHFYVPAFSKIRQLGEPSYGIYIYAYPIQQAIVQEVTHSPLIITLLTLPLTFLVGLASWHFIEKPVLEFKRKH